MSRLTNSSNWPTDEGLRVGYLNICHLINKIADASKIIDNHNKPFHIFCFSESWLNKRIKNTSLTIPGYFIVRRDPKIVHETGLIVYVQKTVSFKIRLDLCHPGVEVLWIEIKSGHTNKSPDSLLICFLYKHSKCSSQWYDDFSDMMDNVWLLQKEILLMGDLNMDLLQLCSKWQNIFTSYNLTQCVNVATRITQKCSSLLDHIYSSNINSLSEICVPTVGCSDHNAICVTWRKKGFKIPKTTHILTMFRSFKKFDLLSFQSDLQAAPFQNIYGFADPDEALLFWSKTLLTVVNKHIPFIQKRVKSKILPGWLTKDILLAMEDRDRLKKNRLFDEYKKKRNVVKYLIRKSKRNFFEKLIEDKSNTASIWKAIRQLTKPSSPDVDCNISANAFNNHFTDIGKKLISKEIKPDSFDTSALEQFCLLKNIKTKFSVPLMSVQDVLSYIGSLKNKTSCGFDEISPQILKLSAPFIADSITYLLNLCLSKNYFPDEFKYAKIIPLHKKGDVSDINNYRPISLLPVISKVLEHHIHIHLTTFIEKYQLLNENQSGFRKHHSCETTLCKITDSWLQAINNRLAVGVIFIDLTKAFDLINHDVLIHKLKIYGFDDSCMQLFKSYLSNRTQSVYSRGVRSSKTCICRGVPQGSILGPILFSLYINDLPLVIPKAKCNLFADDTSLHHADYTIDDISRCLNRSMKSVDNWCKANDMIIHPEKTESMLVCTRQKRQRLSDNQLNIKYKDSLIKQVSKHKLLGITIDQNLNWQEHISILIKQVSSTVFQLSQIKHFLNEHSRRLFYFSYIQSRLNYCSIIWGNCCPSTIKPLLSLQKRAVRMIRKIKPSEKSMTNIFKDLNILPLSYLVKYNTLLLMHKVVHHDCPQYIKSIFCFRSHRYSKRALIPKTNIDLFKMSVSFRGSKEWNALPNTFRELSVLSAFKAKLKILIFDTCD